MQAERRETVRAATSRERSATRDVPVYLAVAGAVALLGVAWPRAAGAKPTESAIPTLPIVVSVAPEEAPSEGEAAAPRPARDADWIDAQVAAAERLFGAHGIHFARTETRALAPRFTHLETRADRDALARELVKGKINVFVVGSLRDVDDPSRLRMGVHWRPKAQLSKHYVILAASAMNTTLAHELGHFFGNGHTDVVNNVMSYTRTSDDVFLDERQVDTSRKFARLYVRIRELAPVSEK